MRTVYLNASYFPAVELLSAIGTAAIILYGGYQAIDGQHRDRRRGRVHRLPAAVLRPDPADLAALHDLPAGDGGARQDLRPARHRARHGRRAPTRSTPGSCAARSSSTTSGSPTRGGGDASRGRRSASEPAGRCEAIDLHVPAGQTVALVGETGAGKSTLAKLVARFYDPQRGRVLVDGHDLRELQRAGAAQPARDRSPGGLSVLGHDPREHRLRPARTPATRRSRAAARAVGAETFVDRLAERIRHRGRRAGRGALSRPAPARRLRARAARRAADPDPRRGDVERRRAHRAGDRGGPRAAAARPHRDRDRAPALDDPPRRPDRRARARPDRRVRHARRADRGRRPLRASSTGPGRNPPPPEPRAARG